MSLSYVINHSWLFFSYEKCAISVRLGKVVPRQLVVSQADNASQWKCLCIEGKWRLLSKKHHETFKCLLLLQVSQYLPDKNTNISKWMLHISEPFDLSNTARSVYNDHTFLRCRRVFKSSFTQLRQTGDGRRIINNPV